MSTFKHLSRFWTSPSLLVLSCILSCGLVLSFDGYSTPSFASPAACEVVPLESSISPVSDVYVDVREDAIYICPYPVANAEVSLSNDTAHLLYKVLWTGLVHGVCIIITWILWAA